MDWISNALIVGVYPTFPWAIIGAVALIGVVVILGVLAVIAELTDD